MDREGWTGQGGQSIKCVVECQAQGLDGHWVWLVEGSEVTVSHENHTTAGEMMEEDGIPWPKDGQCIVQLDVIDRR